MGYNINTNKAKVFTDDERICRVAVIQSRDLRRLQEMLLLAPKIGDVIKGTGGIRKVRFAFKGRGKSGSARVIYIDFETYEKLYLLTAYTKNEKENISDAERKELHNLVDILEKELENKYHGGKS